jgi:hypothetical protein
MDRKNPLHRMKWDKLAQAVVNKKSGPDLPTGAALERLMETG